VQHVVEEKEEEASQLAQSKRDQVVCARLLVKLCTPGLLGSLQQMGVKQAHPERS